MPTGQLTVHFDWEPFKAAIGQLRRPALDQAVALALVDTAKAANGKAASAAAKHTALKVARVKAELSYSRVPVGQYFVHLFASKRLIPLIDFKARQTGAGVRAAKPWGRAQVFKSTFIATMKKGHKGVYRRVGKPRLPIVEMMGPSILGTYNQPDVQAIVTATIRARLPVLLARRIRSQQRRAK